MNDDCCMGDDLYSSFVFMGGTANYRLNIYVILGNNTQSRSTSTACSL